MNRQFIMYKDAPVLEITEAYRCHIIDYDHLPIALRYHDVTYDDIMHGWTETRTMNIGKTNGKKILAACGISQNNPYLIAKACHFATLSDCYWIKEENETITWNEVSLFQNNYNEVLTNTALFGKEGTINFQRNHIHTPELGTQGFSAKAWIRENVDIYLYKIGKIEVAASQILETLKIDHVPYFLCTKEELQLHTDFEHLTKIEKAKENVVKSKCITTEIISIISWEDFAIYCEKHQKNPYEIMIKKWPKAFYEMQIADYILGNDDRHTANYGFFVNNETGKVIVPYPLMDHDHAFHEEELKSQTNDKEMTMKEAAYHALEHYSIDLEPLLKMKQPDTLKKEQWNAVLRRTELCITHQQHKPFLSPSLKEFEEER